MAVLHNAARNLRFFIEWVDREVPPVVPGQPPPSAEAVRALGTAGVEFFDRRDNDFWPFIRLPVIYYSGKDGPALVSSVRDLLSLKIPGFAFRTGATGELGLQIGRDGETQFVVEAGIDLAPYLMETSGASADPGRELAMFRFNTVTAELVKFADGLKKELDGLPPIAR